jgi:hypothetical protein
MNRERVGRSVHSLSGHLSEKHEAGSNAAKG